MSKRIPEMREEDASDDVRAIYADIKQATGIPYVNLIFRHLAVHPEMLAWAWEAIGPLYHEGRIEAAVRRLQIATPPSSDPSPGPIWSGLGSAEAEQIKAILAFYNRGNPANLIGLSTLVAAARGGCTGDRQPRVPATSRAGRSDHDAALPNIPPLPRPEQLAPESVALARELSARQNGADQGIVPSLYLHISLWPAAMVAAHRIVLPLLTAVSWPEQLADTVASARHLAAELAADLDVARPELPAETFDTYIETMDRFTVATIPEMVIIGRVLAGGG